VNRQIFALAVGGQGGARGDGGGLAEDRPVLEDHLDLLVVSQQLFEGRRRRFADRALVVGEDDDGDVRVSRAGARGARIAQDSLHDRGQSECLALPGKVLEDGGRRQADEDRHQQGQFRAALDQ
jgi:hypothetical protein